MWTFYKTQETDRQTNLIGVVIAVEWNVSYPLVVLVNGFEKIILNNIFEISIV